MSNRTLMTNVAVLLSSCMALVVAGCHAPSVDEDAEGAGGADPSGAQPSVPSELSEREEAGHLDEGVGVSQEALVACETAHHHGGDTFEREYTIAMGCACGPGQVKDRYDVWNSGHGACWPLGWASSDPRDCRVSVRIKNSGGWFYGDCHTRVEEKPDPALSCDGRCGGAAPGGCFCDSVCSTYGDCCSDYAPECNPNSCSGSCGGRAPGGCWCDSACSSFGDCCSDYAPACK
ncbi:hypothetical protein [Sorangium sp. So ce1078]|uniref:hypothetical protein n=1 Tax=Sorangium sp. So ce1078 TaxID=3133329 RepID=UPI003F5F8043